MESRRNFGEVLSERWEAIRASETFDRSGLVKHHIRSYQEFQSSLRSDLFSLKTSVTEPSSPSTVPLEGLREIQLPDLRVGEIHTGRVVYGTLCVDAFKVVGIYSVMEDEYGRAVRLSIYNVALSTSTFEDVQRLYPKGTKLAIKEPFVKRGSADGCVMIRVDNPKTIEFLSSPEKTASISTCLNVEELRKRGNRCFGDGDWTGAVSLYTLCIEKATNEEPASLCSTSANKSENQNLLLSYANRAETWLKLNNFEQALCDCDKALEIDSQHLKTIYRKGRALHGLQQYEEAITCLQSALNPNNINPNNNNNNAPEIKTCLDRAVEFNTQSQTGKYDLSDYFLQGKMENAPEVADFVGSVVVQRTRDGRRRGLFVTENVKAGDLLLVSNALAVAYGDVLNPRLACITMDSSRKHNHTACQEDLIAKLVNLAMASRKATRQLYTLADHASGQDSMEVPSMELFIPNKAYRYCTAEGGEAKQMELDVDRIRDIVALNSFGNNHESNFFSTSSKNSKDRESSGLWVLPSFMNHSCLPNTSRLFVGEAMFVHAARSISRGEELTTAYFDVLKPFVERSRSCKNWGFVCTCKRCTLEQSLQQSMDHIISWYLSRLECIEQREFPRGPHLCDIPEFTRIAQEIEQIISLLRPVKRHWIRASFSNAYLQAFTFSRTLYVGGVAASPTLDVSCFADSLKFTVPGNPVFPLVVCPIASQVKSEAASSSSQIEKALKLAKEACVAVIGNHHEERVIHAFICNPLRLYSFV
eukprot:Gb_24395 [translate_table: standard]